jgi:hypothetical protein
MARSAAKRKLSSIKHHLSPDSLAPFRLFLPDSDIVEILFQLKYGWRDRIYTPLVVWWAMVAQCLASDHSCSAAVVRVRSWLKRGKAPGQKKKPKLSKVSHDSGSYCRARERLPLELFEQLTRKLGRDVHAEVPQALKPFGRDVYLTDGATLSTSDTPDLAKAFGKHSGGTNKSEFPFPLVNIVVVISLATGAVMDLAIGSFATSEHALFKTIRQGAKWLKGAIVVGDSLFGCYGELAELSSQEIDLISSPYGRRKCDFTNAKRLKGLKQYQATWKRGKRPPAWLGKKSKLPKDLTVRLIQVRVQQKGFRPEWVPIVTTLLDEELYPAKEIADLFLRRWEIEVDLRHLKSVMAMDVLRSRTSDTVRKEIWAFMAAYNLVRRVMWLAGECGSIHPVELSFTRTLQQLRIQLSDIETARDSQQASRYWRQLLKDIARLRVRKRPGRREPRAARRSKDRYPILKTKRKKAKAQMKKGLANWLYKPGTRYAAQTRAR